MSAESLLGASSLLSQDSGAGRRGGEGGVGVVSLQTGTTEIQTTAAHSNILAWRIPWTEESGGLQSVHAC